MDPGAGASGGELTEKESEKLMTSDEMFALKPQIEAEIKRKAPSRKLERMHVLYGRREGQKCGDCVSFVVRQFANRYFKCARFGETGGPASDWRVSYQACGKFEPMPAEQGN